MKTKVRASVIVEVDVSGESTWSAETSIAQINKQAIDDFNHTISLLRRQSIIDGVSRSAFPIRIISEPRVQMVIFDQDAPKG